MTFKKNAKIKELDMKEDVGKVRPLTNPPICFYFYFYFFNLLKEHLILISL